MGKFFSKRKPEQEVQTAPPQSVEPEDPGLRKIRNTLNQDLDKFLLNNILLSVQFFGNFEREVKALRDNKASEGDADRNKALERHHKYCISPDRLYEVVRRRVLFRPTHGERSHSYELLHSPRLMVVQDNVEVGEPREEAVYATVTGTPNYRFVMEPTTNNRPGYVKLRAEECMLPHKRRTTYETIKDEDEDVYTRIPSDSPIATDSGRSTIQEQVVESDKNSSCPETRDLTETESAGNGPPFHEVQSTVTDYTQTQRINAPKHVFGPQHPNCDPNKMATFTPTERRLSGIMRMPKNVDARTFQKNRGVMKAAQSTPNLAAIRSPKDSGSSGYKSDGESPDNDEYGYTTITQITTPRPLKEHRLGHTPQNTSEIPEQCFHEVEVPVYDDEEESGNMKRRKKLFETHYYLNSILFMQNFEDIFADKIGASLGFTPALNSATTQGTKIYCNITQTHYDSKPIKIRHEIIPTIFCPTWPEEALQGKTLKRRIIQGSAPGAHNRWPTQTMMNEMNYGCHLLPLGYMQTRGRNNEQYLEWQLAFPEVERYLETRLTHAQVRCLLFSMALYKTFLEPLNTQLGLLPIHIRTMLFWQCEQYAEWPEDRPGQILQKFLDKLYDAIRRKHLEDYFIEKRNLFESTPRTHLLKVQEKLLRIKENLVMHVLIALRNLRYIDTAFYPVLDYKKLYDIIISHENPVPNPRPQQPTINTVTPKNKQSKQQSEEEESDEEEKDSNTDLWKRVAATDKEKKWKQHVRTQIELERAAQKLQSKAQTPAMRKRKPSTDSIDIKLQPKKSADKLKMTALLDFFIPHFIEMARKSSHFKATQQARFYRQHAERLQKLLRECANGRDEEGYYSEEFKKLYEEMDKESRARPFTSTHPKQPASREPPTKPEKHRSVNFLQSTSSQDYVFNNANPFRNKMNPHTPLPSTKTCDEQPQPNTNIVTRAQVYEPNTGRKTHTPPTMSTSPESRTDVPDNPSTSPTLTLTDDITVESTDT